MLRRIIWVIGSIALIFFTSVIVFLRPKTSTATLVVTTGQATVHKSDWILVLLSQDQAIAGAGQAVTVHAGDIIELHPGSEAQLSLFDGSTVDLFEGAEIQVLELTTTQENFRVRLNLLAGKTVNRVLRLIGAGDIYEIITPSSTISVRGTVFTAQVLDPASSYIACHEGVVHVVMSDQEADVQEGEQLTARLGEPLQVIPLAPGTQAPEMLSPPPTEQLGDEPVTTPEVTPSDLSDEALPGAPDTLTGGTTDPEGDAIETPAPDSSEAEPKPEKEKTPDNPDQVPGDPPSDGPGSPPDGGGNPPGQDDGSLPPGQTIDKDKKPPKEK